MRYVDKSCSSPGCGSFFMDTGSCSRTPAAWFQCLDRADAWLSYLSNSGCKLHVWDHIDSKQVWSLYAIRKPTPKATTTFSSCSVVALTSASHQYRSRTTYSAELLQCSLQCDVQFRNDEPPKFQMIGQPKVMHIDIRHVPVIINPYIHS